MRIRAISVFGAALAIALLAAPQSSAGQIATGFGAARAGVDTAGHIRLTHSTARGVLAPEDGVPDIQWPPAGVVEPKYPATTLRQFADAMSKHLNVAFPSIVPQAQGMRLIPWGGDVSGRIYDGQDYLSTFAVYHDTIGRTAVYYDVEAPGHYTASPRQKCAMDAPIAPCMAITLPDGSVVLDDVSTTQGNGIIYHIENVLDYRPDGSVVYVEGFDYDPIFDGSPDAGPKRDKIAVSTDQLIALATDPAIHL